MTHYLWAVIYTRDFETLVRWRVTTDPHPAHLDREKWVRVAEFKWGGQ